MKSKIMGFIFLMSIMLFTMSTQAYATSGIVNKPTIGDLDGDGNITSADYALMKKYILGQIKHFPIEAMLIASVEDINASVQAGQNFNLPATVIATMYDGSQKSVNISWSPTIVNTTIPGQYNFTGTVDGYLRSIKLTLTVSGGNTVTVTLDKQMMDLNIGGTYTLVATVSPQDAANKTVNWTTNNSSVATVDSTGKVTAVAAGVATITATPVAGGTAASCVVTVHDNGPVYDFKVFDSLLPGKKTVVVKLIGVTPTDYDVYVKTTKLDYDSSQGEFIGDVLTADAVESNLKIQKKQTPVTVTVTLDKQTMDLNIGGTYTLVATVSPQDAANKTVNWTTNNSSVATVDSTGKVTAVTAGVATITATPAAGGTAVSCVVTVHDNGPVYDFKVFDSLLPGMKTIVVKLIGVTPTDYDVYVKATKLEYDTSQTAFIGDVLSADALQSNLRIVKKN